MLAKDRRSSKAGKVARKQSKAVRLRSEIERKSRETEGSEQNKPLKPKQAIRVMRENVL